MDPRYYDAAGHIDYPAIRLYTVELRRSAIEAFWAALVQRVASRAGRMRVAFAQLHPPAGAHHA